MIDEAQRGQTINRLQKQIKQMHSDFQTLKRHATYSYEVMQDAEELLKRHQKNSTSRKVRARLRIARVKLGYFGAHP